MGEVTKIAWCDHTFNPWIGCTRVSPGCQHCYAETQNNFHKWNGGAWGPGTERRITSDGNWAQLRKWDRKAVLDRVRRRVFVASLADVFDAEAPLDTRERLWLEIESCAHGLDFLLLTKRPENWSKYLPAHWLSDWPAHVRLGFTAEDQTRWEERAKIALDFRLTVRNCLPFFVSCEPLVGEIDLQLVQLPGPNQLAGHDCAVDLTTARINERPMIGWVIVGGESGHDARQMQADWARRVRDQCTHAGVPFFFKQWGEWMPTTDPSIAKARGIPLERCMSYVGKKAAGNLLDGREWIEFPA
jgi:protein gp37